MNKKLKGGILVLTGIAMLPAQVMASPILQQRCSADSLSVEEAAARIEWARKCGLTVNVGTPAGDATFDTGIPASNGGSLIDYTEADDRNPEGESVYSGNNYAFEINSTFTSTLYLSGGTSQSTDGVGTPTMGYKRWTRDASRKRPRPLYPTFGTSANLADAGNLQLWPNKANTAECKLFKSQSSANASTQSNSFYVNGYCEASCYTPDQQVLFAGGYAPILDALNARREDMVTLSPEATLDNVKMQTNRTFSYTAETRDTKHEIFVLMTKSGGELRVTNQHPVLDGSGRMVQAQTLQGG